MRTVLRANHLTCSQMMRDLTIELLTLSSRRLFMHLQLVFKIVNNQHCPSQLHYYDHETRMPCGSSLRDRQKIHLPKVRSTVGQSTFKFTEAKDWNELPIEVRPDGLTLGYFKGRPF